MRLRQQVRAAIAGTALVVAAPGAFAATITVTTTADGQGGADCTLRDAINAANGNVAAGGCMAGDDNNDMIVFGSGVAGQTITLGGTALPTVMAGSALTIGMQGDDNANVTIDADTQSRIFTNQGMLTLNGLTLVNGVATTADGDADARSGGAILNDDGGVLVVNGGAMNNNTADRAGGAIEEASGASNGDDSDDGTDNVAVTLNGVDFSGNDAGANPGNGGALHVTGSADIVVNGGTFDANTATEGGALWNNAGTMTVDGATFTANTATGPAADEGGGAIFGEATGGTIRVTDSSFANNSAGSDDETSSSSGGAILLRAGGTLSVADSSMKGNSANRAGGAIEVLGDTTTTLDNVTATGNNAGMNPGNGGVVHVTGDGDVNVIGGLYANNVAVEGGAFWNNQGEMSFDGVSIVGNEATGADATQGGGGIYAETNADGDSGSLTIVNSRIANNTASGTSGSGGGILVSPNASAEITDTRIAGNSAQRAGGGIENAGGAVTMTRVTLGGTDSSAANDAGANPGNGGGLHIGGAGTTAITRSSVGYNTAVEGGGLWNSGAGTLTVDTSTVSNNTADTGAGVYLDGAGGTITLESVSVTQNVGTGVAANTDDGMTGVGDSISISNSLIANNDPDLGDGVSASSDDGNVVGAVTVGSYRLFGGTTATQPLTADSAAALDANDGCGDTDQRGAPRPFDLMDDDDDGSCDAGAFELTDDPVLSVTATSPSSVTAQDSGDTDVIGLTLTNDDDSAATVAGFSGYIDRGSMDDDSTVARRLMLAGVALTVYQDSNGNGRRDSGENPVGSGTVADNGTNFSVSFTSGGASIPAMDSTSYVVTADLSGDDGQAVAAIGSFMPLYAGGALLGLVGLLSVGGVRRRTQLLLVVMAATIILTACSDSDNDDNVGVDAPPPGGMNGGGNGGGDLMTTGQFQFVVQSLDAGAADALLIGDNLPVKGSVILFAEDDQAD
ncbi:extracellular nuclease [Salinisphaera sp. T31B1]